ncbi:hypothetical protein GA0070623_1175 [Micromonospora rifamycinica]|uniref:Uncharacterized protein n=1 Tax=Micromonospora rifamycinica TaxID=291594 RepID=A0A1C5HFC7_9ACTN|nr:hypothetical protein GA0070623_1175 [Micromonospora rifamycinica]
MQLASAGRNPVEAFFFYSRNRQAGEEQEFEVPPRYARALASVKAPSDGLGFVSCRPNEAASGRGL